MMCSSEYKSWHGTPPRVAQGFLPSITATSWLCQGCRLIKNSSRPWLWVPCSQAYLQLKTLTAPFQYVDGECLSLHEVNSSGSSLGLIVVACLALLVSAIPTP
ncbi:unnamed protein product [Mycena citricolor]|uniref:Uncharacterized protein n=1 Tax=Mycena citricolor TaxID=2018698 RepID=A0AAD2H8N5_9AGAR|nr:unnamed protein product [Mycena citricolor]